MKLPEPKPAIEIPDDKPPLELVPNGVYQVKVDTAENYRASTGTPGVNLKLEIMDEGKHKGWHVFDTIWLTERSAWAIKRTFAILGFELTDDMIAELVRDGEVEGVDHQLPGLRAVVLVEREDYVNPATGESKPKAKVKRWEPHPDGPPSQEADIPF